MTMNRSKENGHPLPEMAAVTVICFGWFMLTSIAAAMNGFPTGGDFNDASLWMIVRLECVLGAVALLYLRLRGHSIFKLLPTPSLKGSGLGILIFIGAGFVAAVVGSLLSPGQLPEQPIDHMVEQSRPSMLALVALAMVNGLYEETFLAGYLLEGLRKHGIHIALGITTLIRLLYHLYQGPIGAASVTAYGLVVMLFYWRFRLLWPIVFAHTLADITAFIP